MGRAQDIRDGLAPSADANVQARALAALTKAENRKAAALERIAAALETLTENGSERDGGTT